MSIKLIIGLRNPGAEYAQTRHNAGEWFIHALRLRFPIAFHNEKNFYGELGKLAIENHNALVLLPNTFMNHSGQPTRAISQFYRLFPEQILIIHDDLDLPTGVLRLKSGGGHGGHNGLKDIVSQLGSNAFHRLRIGIGHPGDKTLVHNYVLGRPSLADKLLMEKNFAQGIGVIPLVLAGNIASAMNTLNQQGKQNGL